MAEEPLLPVLLLLSDIALFRLSLARHGADSAVWYSADDGRNNVPALNVCAAYTKCLAGELDM